MKLVELRLLRFVGRRERRARERPAATLLLKGEPAERRRKRRSDALAEAVVEASGDAGERTSDAAVSRSWSSSGGAASISTSIKEVQRGTGLRRRRELLRRAARRELLGEVVGK